MKKKNIVKLPKNQPKIQGYAKGMTKLLEPFVYKVTSGKIYRIPKGFEFDGASIPRMVQDIIGGAFLPQFLAAAAVHDYLYEKRIGSRKVADKVLKEILIANKVPKAKASVMYAAVRVGGWYYWRKCDER